MEQIGLLAIFALFWLIQLVVRALRARREVPAPTPTPPPPSRRLPPVVDDEEAMVRLPARGPAPAPEPRPVRADGTRRSERRARPRTKLGTRRDLRRAIVVREVLGPCVAMQAGDAGDLRAR